MGVWIEITDQTIDPRTITVTPFMGVWIEIIVTSLAISVHIVTPFMGVWIEIKTYKEGQRLN